MFGSQKPSSNVGSMTDIFSGVFIEAIETVKERAEWNSYKAENVIF